MQHDVDQLANKFEDNEDTEAYQYLVQKENDSVGNIHSTISPRKTGNKKSVFQ